MGRNMRAAFLIVAGALLLVAESPHAHRDTQKKIVAAPFRDGWEVVAFSELPSETGSEFRCCVITVVDQDGVSRTVTLKAKKELVSDSIRCSIKDFFW